MRRVCRALWRAALAGALLLAVARPVAAAEDCFLAVELESGQVIAKQGLCAARHSPCSTFKIALALMGYDAGLLKDADSPVLTPDMAPDPEVVTWRKVWDGPQTPASWMKESVVWYSQILTTRLGPQRFADYVKAFAYGNEDVAGNPGKNDGLLRAWLTSSLRISPREQVDFLRRMLKGQLPVAPSAVDRTMVLLAYPDQPAGWTLFGKTGAGFLPDASGKSDRNRPIGWFVGWAQKNGHTIVFARFSALDRAVDEPLSYIVRRQAIASLATVLATQGR